MVLGLETHSSEQDKFTCLPTGLSFYTGQASFHMAYSGSYTRVYVVYSFTILRKFF